MKRRSRLIARKSICIPDSLSEGQIVIPGVARDIANPGWEEAGSHILIVRLSPWKDVEISTSHLVLFSETRESQPDAYIDFAFLPSAPDRRALSRAGYPWFFGRQSRKSPAEFDLVMISNAFGLELVNLSHFYSTSHLPGSAVQRAGMDGMPVIIMGGSNASAMGSIVQMSQARGPASDALVDGIFFGEGEGAIGELSLILTGRKEAAAGGQRSHDSAAARRRRLEEATRIKGFWPCLLGEAAEKAVVGKRPSSVSHTLVLNGPNALVTKLAITSGCPGYCSFCMEGWDRRPYAEADVDEVLRQARELRARTGADTLELYSFNFNTHSRIFELIYELNRIFPHVSLMSQRLDILSDTRGLFEAEVSAGKRSFTFGIEGISTRMRSYYHKGISAQQIGNCLDMVIRSGARELKLFFIIAGIEDSDDVDEFSALMQAIREKRKAAMASTRVLVSAGFLVRLPFTPLQYAPLAFDENRLSGLSSSLATCCQVNGIEYRTAVALDEYFVDQTISLSGGILFPWMADTAKEGLVFDSNISKGTWESLDAFCKANHLVETGFLDEKDAAYRPPFAFIEPETHWTALRRQYETARDFDDRKPCLGGSCSACGACQDASEVKLMTGHIIATPGVANFQARMTRLLEVKTAFKPVCISAFLPEELSRSCLAYRESWVSRSLSALVPGAEKLIFRVSEVAFNAGQAFGSMLQDGEGRFGVSLFVLFGPDENKSRSLLGMVAKAGARARVPESIKLFASSVQLLPEYLAPRRISASIDMPDPGLMPGMAQAVDRFLDHNKLACKKTRSVVGTGESIVYEFPESRMGRRFFFDATLGSGDSGVSFLFSAGDRAKLSPLLKILGETCGTIPAVCIRSLE